MCQHVGGRWISSTMKHMRTMCCMARKALRTCRALVLMRGLIVGCDAYEVKEQSVKIADSEVLVLLRIVDESMQIERSPWARPRQ